MMINWLIIYKNIVNSATQKERDRYVSWLKKSDRHLHYSKKMARYCENNGAFAPLSNEQLLQNLSNLKRDVSNLNSENNIRKELKRRRLRILVALSGSAAAVIFLFFILNSPIFDTDNPATVAIKVPTLILSSGSSLELEGDKLIDGSYPIEKIDNKKISYLNKPANNPEYEAVRYNTLIVPNLYTYTIILDDSTEVFLNANSELRYPVSFSDKTREVFLRGEGYFKVAKNKMPFIVHTDEMAIKVYGTEFNINAYNKVNIRAVLLSGSVSVTVKSMNMKEIRLSPNQKFILNSISEQCHITTVNPDNEVSWKNGVFKYDCENLSTILSDIANWYGVEFNYSNMNVKSIPISLKFKRTIDLDNIIRAIETISGAKIIKVNKNRYDIE